MRNMGPHKLQAGIMLHLKRGNISKASQRNYVGLEILSKYHFEVYLEYVILYSYTRNMAVKDADMTLGLPWSQPPRCFRPQGRTLPWLGNARAPSKGFPTVDDRNLALPYIDLIYQEIWQYSTYIHVSGDAGFLSSTC